MAFSFLRLDPGGGFEPHIHCSKGRCPTVRRSRNYFQTMAPSQGFEPRSAAPEAAVLPLNELGMADREGVEPPTNALTVRLSTIEIPANKRKPLALCQGSSRKLELVR